MRKLALVLACVLGFSSCNACVLHPPVSSPDSENSILQHASERTVHVQIYRKLYKGDKIFKEAQEYGWGTGTILYYKNLYSYILTANHVVDSDGDFTLYFDKLTREFSVLRAEYFIVLERRNLSNEVVDKAVHVEVIKQDRLLDLALLKVPYNFGVKTKLAQKTLLGETIYSFGYPLQRGIEGAQLSFAKGYIKSINFPGLNKMPGQVKIGTSLYSGNSGGGIFNEKGELTAAITLMTGWSLGDEFIPQQDCFYGPGAESIRHFLYNK